MQEDQKRNLLGSLINSILSYRFWVLAAVGLAASIALYFAAQVRFSNSIEMWFLEGDPELKAYDEFTAQFGADELAIIGVMAEDVFTREILEVIESLTQSTRGITNVHGVRSLTSELVPGTVADVPEAGLKLIREKALASRLINGWLVFSDGKAAAILVELAREGNTVDGKTRLVDELRSLINEQRRRNPDISIFVSGTPVLDEAFFRYNDHDVTILFPLSIFLVIAAGLAAFRRLSVVAALMAIVGFSLLGVFGLMGCLGLNMNILSTGLPPLVLAIGIADSVHLLNEYGRRMAAGETEKNKAIIDSITYLLKPCTFTSMTTIVGLLSLTISPMRPIREFGILAAAGVFFAYVLSMTMLPALLSVIPQPRRRPHNPSNTGKLDWILDKVSGHGRRIAWCLVIGCSMFSLWQIWLITRLEVGVYALSWFPADDPIVEDIRLTDEHLGGSTALEFIIKAPGSGLADPDVLNRLIQFQGWLEGNIAGVSSSLSIADVVGENRGLPHRDMPDISELDVEQELELLRLKQSELVDRFISTDNTVGRITAQIRLDQSPTVVKAFHEIEQQLESVIENNGIEAMMTGYGRLMGKMEDYLIDSQIRSFLLAFAVISIMMIILLRSLGLGLFAMIPNLLPVLMGLGTMGLLGISLNPGTIMIGAIALGLVVDDSVHFLVSLKRELKNNGDIDAAISHAVRTAGRPIVITSLILMTGFGVLVFGSFSPNVHFGAVSALVIGFALLCDLILLPALLIITRLRLVD